MKSYFLLKDNVLDKKILNYVDSLQFSKRKTGHELMDKFVKFYAKNFTNNDKEKA